MKWCVPVRRSELTEKGVACPPQWLPVLLATQPLAPPTRRRHRLVADKTPLKAVVTAFHNDEPAPQEPEPQLRRLLSIQAPLPVDDDEFDTPTRDPGPGFCTISGCYLSTGQWKPASTSWLKTAVRAFDADADSAIATYGPIADWDVSAITDMSGLFKDLKNFDADISNWNTSGVTTMSRMVVTLEVSQLEMSALTFFKL